MLVKTTAYPNYHDSDIATQGNRTSPRELRIPLKKRLKIFQVSV